MKILIAPDSFKEALSSIEVCEAIQRGAKKALPGADFTLFPLSDGGEGAAQVLKYHLKCETIPLNVQDPLGRSVMANYCYLPLEQTAFIEMAQASGLQLLGKHERNPLKTNTFGTGQLISDAIKGGARKIILSIGGSATNDAGMGLAAALGWRFLDSYGSELLPNGENLGRITTIVPPVLPVEHLPEIEVLCDVTNPLFGPEGAAHVFARQKGADEKAVEILEAGLRHFSEKLMEYFNKDLANVPGAGAAGGLGAGAMAFLGASLKPGIGAMLELTGFGQKIAGMDLLLTGEGKLDGQTLHGKLVHGICKAGRLHRVPVIAFCGTLDATDDQLASIGLQAAFSIINKPLTLQESIQQTVYGLENLAYNVLKVIHLGKT